MSNAHTAADSNYRWPAEWELHEATWLTWPHNRETWPCAFESAEIEYAEFVRTLARFEPVRILISPLRRARAVSVLGPCDQVTWIDIETNDSWIRDYGPMFVTAPNGPSALVDWQYNAWGGKYPPWDLDNAVPARIAKHLGCRRFSPGLVLEGGALDGNGQGTALVSSRCVLDSRRNPTVNRTIVERYLAEYCAVVNVLWLDSAPIAGDDTDAHVDQLARFATVDTVVASVSDVADVGDADDDDKQILDGNLAQLQQMQDETGAALNIVPLPTPSAIYYEGRRLPAGYCNFYIANGVVLVPQFDDPADAVALERLTDVFPDREVLGLPALRLIWGLGAFHCLTQQQPLAR